MEARAKILGHPIHQVLIVFPLGLLMTSWMFDIGFYVTHNNTLATLAYWNIAAGIAGGLLAAVFGLIDWIAIPLGTRAKAVGAWHAGWNIVMLMLFGASWVVRFHADYHSPSLLALLLSSVAVAVGGLSGWLGGELVNRLGVGVSPGANLNAPNTLSGKPAAPDGSTDIQ